MVSGATEELERPSLSDNMDRVGKDSPKVEPPFETHRPPQRPLGQKYNPYRSEHSPYHDRVVVDFVPEGIPSMN